ncbi:MAG TPA: hypothetical protein VKD72_07515 [Gemmataceae bacterium]|nr:hypothetical protein [Gemmataceae bacterium]
MPWNLADAARRYEAGESLAHIAQALDTPESTVYRRLLAGGLPPRATAPWGARPRGTRNYARELARHDAIAPEKQRALYDLLVAQLPQHHYALVGWDAILTFLHRSLQLTRPNGGPLSRRQILRWHRTQGFPLVTGNMNRYARTPPLTTSHAVVAWVLTRKSTDECSLFRVRSLPEPIAGEGTRPASHAEDAFTPVSARRDRAAGKRFRFA